MIPEINASMMVMIPVTRPSKNHFANDKLPRRGYEGVSRFQTKSGYALMKVNIPISPNCNGGMPWYSGSNLLTTRLITSEK